MNDKDFEFDYHYGDKAEDLVARALQTKFYVSRRDYGKSHDISVVGENFNGYVEVKCEDAQDTGNLCVEMFQGNPPSPSGISASNAAVWVHTFKDKAVVYLAQQMRLHIKRRQCRLIEMGDNRNLCALIPIVSVSSEWWAEQLKIQRLAQSKVFDACQRKAQCRTGAAWVEL